MILWWPSRNLSLFVDLLLWARIDIFSIICNNIFVQSFIWYKIWSARFFNSAILFFHGKVLLFKKWFVFARYTTVLILHGTVRSIFFARNCSVFDRNGSIPVRHGFWKVCIKVRRGVWRPLHPFTAVSYTLNRTGLGRSPQKAQRL